MSDIFARAYFVQNSTMQTLGVGGNNWILILLNAMRILKIFLIVFKHIWI